MIHGNVHVVEDWKQSRTTNLLDSAPQQMQTSKSDAALKNRQHYISSAHQMSDQLGTFDPGIS